jgi:membrane protease YdiL (CAAX protease family)
MTETLELTQPELNDQARFSLKRASVLLILTLLGIRLLSDILSLFNPSPAWNVVYQLPTYLLTAVVIWLEREQLGELHIDRLALGMFLIVPALLAPFTSDSWLAFVTFPVYWALAIALYYRLSRDGALARLPRLQHGWLWLAAGLAAGLLVGSIRIFLAGALPDQFFNPLAWLGNFLFHLSGPSMNEEPLFRGFLWALLRTRGLSDKAILFIQAVLFAAVHVRYWSNPPILLIIVVAFTLYGFLVMRSRSLAPAMIAHAIDNTISSLYF